MTTNAALEIKDRLNVVDVLSSYIQLKKAGANYKANCPFHHEKTASLMVSPSKQIWHCFGCGEGGDIFAFVMKQENMDFSEALKMLAQRAGVELPKFSNQNPEQDKRKEQLYKINDWAAKFYHQILLQSSVADKARKYLAERGLSQKTIEHWQIGFAPDEFHVLENFLIKKGYSPKDLLDAGVSARNTESQRQGSANIYDRFRNRITFPILNYAGDVVGFTARLLDQDAKAAKYINSPETLIYNKSKIIFGLYQAKQEIRKADSAIVVEGNVDVISAQQAGFANAVGSSGTAFTYEQLQMLSRLTKNLKFAFDTDSAGAQATLRALDSALQLGFSVFVVNITNAKDPDEAIKKDPGAFAEAVKNAPPYLDYFFEKYFRNYDPNSVEQKKEIAAKLLPMLKKTTDPLESAHYIRLLAQRFQVAEKTIYEMLAKVKTEQQSFGAQSRQQEKPERPAVLLKPKTYLLEQRLLGYAIFDKKFAELIKSAWEEPFFTDPQMHSIFQKLSRESEKSANAEAFIEALAKESPKNAELAKMALFMVESEYHQSENRQLFETDFQKTLKELITIKTKIEMEAVIAAMATAEQARDKQSLEKLRVKFLSLSKKLAI